MVPFRRRRFFRVDGHGQAARSRKKNGADGEMNKSSVLFSPSLYVMADGGGGVCPQRCRKDGERVREHTAALR